MMEWSYPLQFLFAMGATAGFCILFNVPRKQLLSSSFIGGCGWVAYEYFVQTGNSKVLSCFIGAAVIAILGEIFCRLFKEAATVFILPGILPLVPGAGMYNTMIAILNKNFETAVDVGVETLLMAGSIAVALLITGTISRTIRIIKQEFR